MLKKILKVVAVLLVIALLAVGVFAYLTFGRVARPTDGERIGSAQSVVIKFSQAFLIDSGDGGVILIDAGVDPGAAAIRAALDGRGLRPDAVRAIFVTHGHADHIGGIAAFPDAAVYAHSAELDLILGKRDSPAPARKVIPHPPVTARVTRTVADGDAITVGSRTVKVFHVPGHTPGSAAYLIDGVLFLGDSATAAKGGEVLAAPWFFSEDTGQNRRELKRLGNRLRSEGVTALAFGHSAPIRGEQLAQRVEAAGE